MNHKPPKTWRDFQDRVRAAGGECSRQNGSHQVWTLPNGEHVTLCDKGNEQVKPGLRCHLIKAFARWGILSALAAAVLWRLTI